MRLARTEVLVSFSALKDVLLLAVPSELGVSVFAAVTYSVRGAVISWYIDSVVKVLLRQLLTRLMALSCRMYNMT